MAMSEPSTSYAVSQFGPPGGKANGHGQTPAASLVELVHRLMARLVRTALAPFWLAAALPYRAALLALGQACAAMVRLLVVLGAPPQWYLRGERAGELARALEVMRQREELYRKKLLELRAQAELRDRDRRRAVRKAKQLSNELTALQGHLAEVQDETRYHAQAATGSAANALPQSELGDAAAAAAARDDGLDDALAGSTGGRLQLQQRRQDASPGMSMLLTAAALVVALYGFFTSDPQSVHKKVVTSLLFPLLYCGYGALQGRGFTTQALVAFCLSWFVIGFVVCNRLQVDEEP